MATNSTVGLTTTLSPLPDILRHGLVAVAFFGILSLISSVALFTFLTYRLCVWYHRGQLRDGANQFLLLIYNLVLAGQFSFSFYGTPPVVGGLRSRFEFLQSHLYTCQVCTCDNFFILLALEIALSEVQVEADRW